MDRQQPVCKSGRTDWASRTSLMDPLPKSYFSRSNRKSFSAYSILFRTPSHAERTTLKSDGRLKGSSRKKLHPCSTPCEKKAITVPERPAICVETHVFWYKELARIRSEGTRSAWSRRMRFMGRTHSRRMRSYASLRRSFWSRVLVRTRPDPTEDVHPKGQDRPYPSCCP